MASLGRMAPRLTRGGTASSRISTLFAQQPFLAPTRPTQQRGCASDSSSEPALLDWLSSYGVQSKQLLSVLDKLGAHTRDDLNHLRHGVVQSLGAADGVSAVQLSRLQSAIDGYADLNRWHSLTGAPLGATGAAWTAHAAATPAARADEPPPAPALQLLPVTAPVVLPSSDLAPAAAGWFDHTVLGRPVGSISAYSMTSNIAFSPCGDYIAAGSSDGLVKIWNVHTGTELAALPMRTSEERKAEEEKEEDTAVKQRSEADPAADESCDDGGAGEDKCAEADRSRQVFSVSWNADGRTLLHTARTSQHTCMVQVLQVPTELVPEFFTRDWSTLPAFATAPDLMDMTFNDTKIRAVAAFSPDGGFAVVATNRGHMYGWDPLQGDWFESSRDQVGSSHSRVEVLAVAMHPDRAFRDVQGLLAAVGGTGGVAVWGILPFGDCNGILNRHPSVLTGVRLSNKKVKSVSMSADGAVLAAGCADGTVSVYDLAMSWQRAPGVGEKPLQPVRTLVHSRSPVTVAVTPCGGGIISAGAEGAVKAWDVASGERTAELQGSDSRWMVDVAVSPDGRRVCAVTKQGVITVWRLK